MSSRKRFEVERHMYQGGQVARDAWLLMQSAVRKYEAASLKLLALRYRDGECDALALAEFGSVVEEIEADWSRDGHLSGAEAKP